MSQNCVATSKFRLESINNSTVSKRNCSHRWLISRAFETHFSNFCPARSHEVNWFSKCPNTFRWYCMSNAARVMHMHNDILHAKPLEHAQSISKLSSSLAKSRRARWKLRYALSMVQGLRMENIIVHIHNPSSVWHAISAECVWALRKPIHFMISWRTEVGEMGLKRARN